MRLSYRPDVDGLRAVAIASVVVFHAFPAWASGGYVGVDVFFVISGYLITRLILNALYLEPSGIRSFSFRRFYAHRIRRLFPALSLVLTACLVLGWFALYPDEYKQLGQEVVAGAAFFENILLWRQAGYFDTAAKFKPLLHLWSLGIEEQFYIVWPLLLAVTVRLRLNPIRLIIAIAIASFLANVIAVKEHAVFAFYSPVTRMWELMMGGVLAYLHVGRGDHPNKRGLLSSGWLANMHPDIASTCGLTLILAAAVFLTKSDEYPGYWAVLPTTGAYLVIAAGPDAWINRRVLGSGPFVFLGLISYPLYLWHWPLLYFQRVLLGNTNAFEFRIAAVVLAVLLASLTYWFIEQNLRFREHWGTTLSLACLMAVVGYVGYNIYSREGLSFRLKAVAMPSDTVVEYDPACRHEFKFARHAFCLLGSAASPPTVALIGDSHARALFAGLERYYAKRGKNLVHFGLGGGIPFYGVNRVEKGHVTNRFSKLYDAALDYVIRDHKIKTVILANRTVWAQPGGALLGALRYERDRDDTNTLDVYRKAMAYTLKRLLAAGKHVVYVIDDPQMNFDPDTCVGRPYGLARPRTPCAIPRALYDAQTKMYRKVVNGVLEKFPSVKVWDLPKYLCKKKLCWAMRDGKLLYEQDGQHLSTAGSYWLARHYSLN